MFQGWKVNPILIIWFFKLFFSWILFCNHLGNVIAKFSLHSIFFVVCFNLKRVEGILARFILTLYCSYPLIHIYYCKWTDPFATLLRIDKSSISNTEDMVRILRIYLDKAVVIRRSAIIAVVSLCFHAMNSIFCFCLGKSDAIVDKRETMQKLVCLIEVRLLEMYRSLP